MKPKISTGYLTPQATKTRKPIKPLSASKPGTTLQQKEEIDHTAFQNLMKDPLKKAMIMQLLSLNKNAIEDYKRKEAQRPSPVNKVKKKRQIESPTSLLRRRALEKLNSKADDSSSRPSSSLSESESSRPLSPQSEFSHTSSDSPVPFERIMDGVVAFVEIKSKDQDRSGGAKKILQAMGAKVRETFTRDVTHVVFKDGSFATYQKAKLMKVHLVSILWVEFSRKSFQRQAEKKFPAMRGSYLDDNTSIICSQMHKEYEDIIRDEYRQSIINGTPLPSTRSLIDRRRTLMTTSSTSDFQNTIDSSSQEIADKEVSQINGEKYKEILTLNSLDFLTDSPEVESPLKSVENTRLLSTLDNRYLTKYNCSDMELTKINSANRPESSFYERPTPKLADVSLSEKTPTLKKSRLAPTSLFDGRKTICNSMLMSEDSNLDKSANLSSKRGNKSKKSEDKSCDNKEKSQDSDLTYCSLISSDKSTNLSTQTDKDKTIKKKNVEEKNSNASFGIIISSEKSSDIFAVPSKTAKKTKKSLDKLSTASKMSALEISDDDDIQIFSRNVCKKKLTNSDKQKQCREMPYLNLSLEEPPESPQRKRASSPTMSSLNLSSEKQLEKSYPASKKKSTDSTMSSLNLSSDKPNSDIKQISDHSKSGSERSLLNSNLKQNKSLDTSTQSFASSDKSMRLDEKQVEFVLDALHTPPSFVTVRKSSRSINSTLSSSNRNSYDSEVDIPKKISRKISKITKKVIKQPEKAIDNQTLLNWLTEGDKEKKSDNPTASLTSKEISKSDDIILETPNRTNDESPKKTVKKTAHKVKRLSKMGRKSTLRINSCDSSDQDENSSKKSLKHDHKKNKGASDDIRPSSDENSPKKSLKNNHKQSNDFRPSMRITRRMTMYQNEPEYIFDKLKRKPQSLPMESETEAKISNRRKIKIGNDFSQLKKSQSVPTDSETDTKSNSNRRRTRSHNSFLNNANLNSKNPKPTKRNTINPHTNIIVKATTSSSESDSNNKSKSGKRKLYDPNEFIPKFSQIDDEKEREERFIEIKKRKSLIPSDVNVKEIAKPLDETKNEDNADLVDLVKALTSQSSKKKQKQQKSKQKLKTPDGSADEQKSLLNELIGRKAKTATKQSSKKKEPTFSKPVSAKSYRESTKAKGCKNLGVNLFPKRTTSGGSSSDDKPTRSYLNRRSTLDFQPRSQVSSSKKPKINKTTLPTIVCTKMHKSDVEVFARIVRKLGGFVVEDEVSSRTTHVVVGEPKRTINMLRAVARGCWILKQEWLLKSLENGKWLPEEDYEVMDFAPVVQKSRLERQAFGPSYTINIFQDCGPIYVALGTNPRCSDLRELIALCKGKVVTSYRMARIIVGEYVRQDDTTCVSEIWILDCITFNKKLPFKKKYLLEEKKGGRKSIAV